MRKAFEDVLRGRLDLISEQTQGDVLQLYKVLPRTITALRNVLKEFKGIITTNYDDYIEEAIEALGKYSVDFGVNVEPSSKQDDCLRVLKLHGSFGWQDRLPITRANNNESTLWIPPGINKAKQAYPFNMLWGLAREMLSCEVLRVIGCRLAANDWDLISLLFCNAVRYLDLPPANRGRGCSFTCTESKGVLPVFGTNVYS